MSSEPRSVVQGVSARNVPRVCEALYMGLYVVINAGIGRAIAGGRPSVHGGVGYQ